MNEYGASESKIVFLEGLPGVGKTTLVNALKLKKNKKYYYKVRAVRKGYINSSFSNIVSTKTKK